MVSRRRLPALIGAHAPSGGKHFKVSGKSRLLCAGLQISERLVAGEFHLLLDREGAGGDLPRGPELSFPPLLQRPGDGILIMSRSDHPCKSNSSEPSEEYGRLFLEGSTLNPEVNENVK